MNISLEVTAQTLQKAVGRCWSESAVLVLPDTSLRIHAHHSFVASSTDVHLRT